MPATTQPHTPGDMILGGFPVRTRTVTVVSGAGELARGAVIGQITASGKYKLALDASGDGSETPRLILAEAVDATSGDVTALAYCTGVFDAAKLTFGAGVTAAEFEAACDAADRSIFIETLA